MKKIATVSVLAIMAVSAARADIASTTYVDKAKTAVEGQVTTLAGRVTTAEGKITTAEGKISTLEGTVGQHTTSIEKNTEDIATNTAAIKNINDGQLNIGEGTIAKSQLTTDLQNQIDGAATQEALNGVSATASAANTQAGENKTAIETLQNAGYQNADQVSTAISTATASGVIKTALDGKVDDSEIVDMAKKSDIGKGTLTVTIDGANAGTFNANAADNGTIAITVPDTYVNETELGSALAPYAKSTDVSTTYATKTALTEGLAEKVNTADVANLSVSHAETAGSATTAAGYTTGGAIAQALDGKVDNVTLSNYYTKTDADAEFINGTELSNQLANYSTTAQMNTELDKKQDKTTAVTHTANTAVGDATHAVYIDSTGAAKVVDKVAAAAAADSATKATQDASGNVITTTYATKTEVNTLTDGLGSLADVQIPDLPGECKGDDATADCTLVIAVGADNALTAKWEKVAR